MENGIDFGNAMIEYAVLTIQNGKPQSVTTASAFRRVCGEPLSATLRKLGREDWRVSRALPDFENSAVQLLILIRTCRKRNSDPDGRAAGHFTVGLA